MRLESRKYLFDIQQAAHGYASVDDRIVWGVIEGDPPSLQLSVATLLEDKGA